MDKIDQTYVVELHYFLGHPVVHYNNFKENVEQHFYIPDSS